MRSFDFICNSCGFKLIDELIENNNDILCEKCGKPMERMFPLVNVQTPPRHHTSLKGYKPGKPTVSFGKVKDGWYFPS